jgi:hypothetical protein
MKSYKIEFITKLQGFSKRFGSVLSPEKVINKCLTRLMLATNNCVTYNCVWPMQSFLSLAGLYISGETF